MNDRVDEDIRGTTRTAYPISAGEPGRSGGASYPHEAGKRCRAGVVVVGRVDGARLVQRQVGGEPRSFVELGSTGRTVAQIEPAWLDSDEGMTMVEAFTGAGDDDLIEDGPLEEALATLNRQASDGTRSAAFILPGCAETGAQLRIDDPVISAELTGGENTNCYVPVFFLTVLEIPEDDIPDGAVLGR